MGRHPKLKEAVLACSVALSLTQQSGAAWSFTQEPVAPPSANTQIAPNGQPPSPGQVPQPQLSDPQPQKPSGTEVRIPGIGSVGTLPKLDFGLELLYGPKTAPEGGMQFDQQQPLPHAQEGDVQIKGTFTHKF